MFPAQPAAEQKSILISLANQVEAMVADIPLDLKVAVMGCVVNGPGEAKEADIGIAGGIGEGLLIKKERYIRRCRNVSSLERCGRSCCIGMRRRHDKTVF